MVSDPAHDLATAIDLALADRRQDVAKRLVLGVSPAHAQKAIEICRDREREFFQDAIENASENNAPFLPDDWFRDRQDELWQLRALVDQHASG